jgi:hypothetical protein
MKKAILILDCVFYTCFPPGKFIVLTNIAHKIIAIFWSLNSYHTSLKKKKQEKKFYLPGEG